MKKLLNFKLSIASALFVITLVTNCFLHHANIQGDAYGAKSLLFEDERLFTGTLPIRVEFDSSEKAFVRDYLERKGQNIEVSNNMIESYFSEEIVAKFRNSKYFTHNPSANMKIRITSSLEEVKSPVISLIAALGTLGIVPAITRTYGRVQFELFDSSKNQSLRTYKYPIQHRQFNGTITVILGSMLPLFSDRFDHSTNEKNFSIMRVAFQQFENDLMTELLENEILVKRFTLDGYKVYALIPFENQKDQSNMYINQLYTGLQTQFIQTGLVFVERRKIKELLSEIKFSNSGLTKSNRIAFGKLTNVERLIIVSDLSINGMEQNPKTEIHFSIRCVEIESGKIIWSRRSNYSSTEKKSIEAHLDYSTRNLIHKLQINGDI